jgi:hypothetical protein
MCVLRAIYEPMKSYSFYSPCKNLSKQSKSKFVQTTMATITKEPLSINKRSIYKSKNIYAFLPLASYYSCWMKAWLGGSFFAF